MAIPAIRSYRGIVVAFVAEIHLAGMTLHAVELQTFRVGLTFYDYAAAVTVAHHLMHQHPTQTYPTTPP